MCFIYVIVTMVFFRSATFGHAWAMLGRMFTPSREGIEWIYVQAAAVLVLAVASHLWSHFNSGLSPSLDLRRPAAWPVLATVLLFILLHAPFGTNPFIYFQF